MEKIFDKYFILKILIIILSILMYIFFLLSLRAKFYKLINTDLYNIKSAKDFIYYLNKYSIYRKPKYILLFDFIDSPVCEDLNSYTIFQYYQKNNIDNAYYVLNEGTELYKTLVSLNKTSNIIPYKHGRDNYHLFTFLLNSKIIIQSYALYFFQILASKVNYLKFLYICHAANYFKTSIIKIQLSKLDKKKQNIILTSPYEYKLYKKMNLYNENSMYKAGLSRYDRLNFVKKNKLKKDCILISFTYRSFKKKYYDKSLFKKNTIKLLKDDSLHSILKKKNIDLIFIKHHNDHNDIKKEININHTFLDDIKFMRQKNLAYYIEQCSLFITDFSSISFDFMFQNKPVLFYHLDKKDKIKFKEKSFMRIDYNNSIYYNNVFLNQKDLVNKIIYYVNRNFTLEEGLANKYKTLFYYRKNITQKIINIINRIIEK